MSKKKKQVSANGNTKQIDEFRKELKQKDHLYCKEWEMSSFWHNGKGHYTWMADQISNGLTILEIGSGTGYSTLALVGKCEKVISIESNSLCLQETAKKLSEAGISYKRIKISNIEVREKSYIRKNSFINKIDYGDAKVILLEADVLDLKTILRMLKNSDLKVEGIVCWLIGACESKAFDAEMISQKITSPGDYRLLVQKKIFDHAKEILSNKGVVHIVDRCMLPSGLELGERDVVESFEEQANDQRYSISLPIFKEYVDESKGVELVASVPEGKRDEVLLSSATSAFYSVIAIYNNHD